jgi:hypothetical protein
MFQIRTPGEHNSWVGSFVTLYYSTVNMSKTAKIADTRVLGAEVVTTVDSLRQCILAFSQDSKNIPVPDGWKEGGHRIIL